jgi:hypothetical protein
MSAPAPRRRVPRPSHLRAQRGAAYAETVVMLPFFIAVWTCMIYVHKAYATKIATMAENRRCVVTYAFNACESMPPGCTVSRGVGSDAGERPSALDGLQNTLGPLGGPLLGAIFGENANQRLTRNVNKPNLLGGGSTTVLAGHSMMCNTRYHDTPANMLRQAFCALARICI